MGGCRVNGVQAWLLATRPKTLTGALIPVILAGALSWRDGAFDHVPVTYGTPLLHWALLGGCALFAALMQVAANLINDLYDYQRGTDREDRLGPERACAQGWITPRAMRMGIGVVVALACLSGLTAVALCWQYLPWRGCELVLLGVACVVFAFLYTTRLSYLGWGDVLVLVFFGLVPVCGTYYLQMLDVSLLSIVLGLISGVAIDALLVVNNYRDREQDRVSGKRTSVVRFGERVGALHYLSIGLVVASLTVWMSLCAGISWSAVAGGAYLAMHVVTWRRMVRIHQGRALNAILGETSRNMFLLSLMLALAILI